MNVKATSKGEGKKEGALIAGLRQVGKSAVLAKFSPAWVVKHSKDAPSYKMELIGRIRGGVTKTDWKQLIQYTGSTEKEFEHILPVSISSMQKKAVYGKETSERIYELARLFGLGYDVFDSKDDLSNGY